VASVEVVVLGPAGPGWCVRHGGKGDMTVWSVTMAFGQLALLMQASGQPGGITLFLPLILIMVIFYFLMIMPAQRRQKKVAQMLKELKTGDKVITNGGIYGTITGLEDDAVQLRIAEQVKVKISRSAIAGLQPDQKESSQ
jgi:preprotein translocase subunit YajC